MYQEHGLVIDHKLCSQRDERTERDGLVREESQILVRCILLNVRIRAAKQGDQDVDKDNGGEEVPEIVHD